MMTISTSLHPEMIAYWLHRSGIAKPDAIRAAIYEWVAPYLEDAVLLGIGGEGAVFSDGGLVKKFIMNTSPARQLKKTYEHLVELSQCLSDPKHLYAFQTEWLEDDLILVCYDYEPTETLSEDYVRARWHDSLCRQYMAFQREILKVGFWITNPKLANFRLKDDTLKFIDYGADCLPIEHSAPEVGRMFFMLLNNVYELGGDRE